MRWRLKIDLATIEALPGKSACQSFSKVRPRQVNKPTIIECTKPTAVSVKMSFIRPNPQGRRPILIFIIGWWSQK